MFLFKTFILIFNFYKQCKSCKTSNVIFFRLTFIQISFDFDVVLDKPLIIRIWFNDKWMKFKTINYKALSVIHFGKFTWYINFTAGILDYGMISMFHLSFGVSELSRYPFIIFLIFPGIFNIKITPKSSAKSSSNFKSSRDGYYLCKWRILVAQILSFEGQNKRLSPRKFCDFYKSVYKTKKIHSMESLTNINMDDGKSSQNCSKAAEFFNVHFGILNFLHLNNN